MKIILVLSTRRWRFFLSFFLSLSFTSTPLIHIDIDTIMGRGLQPLCEQTYLPKSCSRRLSSAPSSLIHQTILHVRLINCARAEGPTPNAKHRPSANFPRQLYTTLGMRRTSPHTLQSSVVVSLLNKTQSKKDGGLEKTEINLLLKKSIHKTTKKEMKNEGRFNSIDEWQ